MIYNTFVYLRGGGLWGGHSFLCTYLYSYINIYIYLWYHLFARAIAACFIPFKPMFEILSFARLLLSLISFFLSLLLFSFSLLPMVRWISSACRDNIFDIACTHASLTVVSLALKRRISPPLASTQLQDRLLPSRRART